MKTYMMDLLLLIVWFNIVHVNGRIVFEEGSDVGYILPDNSELSYNNNRLEELESKSLKSDDIKNEVKRAFWSTVLDDFSGIKGYDRLRYEKGTQNLLNVGSNGLSSTSEIPEELKDAKHGVKMGVSDHRCDDGETMLEVDWDGSPINYTCYLPKSRFSSRADPKVIETCDNVPPNYLPKHHCMKDLLNYNTSVPTYGPHRPLWPVYGEYKFVPTQRWLHSVEHGSIVMLYHPCTQPLLVDLLKMIVRGCIFKHVITPSTALTEERPLALVAWGCKLEMSSVDEAKVVEFIRNRALHGPEGELSRQGYFKQNLLVRSVPPVGSDRHDRNLCPSQNS